MLGVDNQNKFDWKNIGLADCLKGNALDSYFTLKVYEKLFQRVEDLGLVKLYEKLIAPLSVAFRDMEYDGLIIDPKVLADLKKDISEKLASLEVSLRNSPRVPADSNLSSTRDLIKILFSLDKVEDKWEINDSYGFGLYPPMRTAKDQPSTDDETLKQIKTLIDEEYVKRGLNVKETN